MPGTFHWVKVRLFCYSTENEEKLKEVMTALVGDEGFTSEVSEGHHGNITLIFNSEMTKNKDAVKLFTNLGSEMIEKIIEEVDERVDNDCVFYMRLDKQKAVLGEYRLSYHGDVISITAKIISHPAKKEIAAKNMKEFLLSIL